MRYPFRYRTEQELVAQAEALVLVAMKCEQEAVESAFVLPRKLENFFPKTSVKRAVIGVIGRTTVLMVQTEDYGNLVRHNPTHEGAFCPKVNLTVKAFID